MMKKRFNGKKLIVIGMLMAFMCMATACTRNKDNNNDPSDMAGNQTTDDNSGGATANNSGSNSGSGTTANNTGSSNSNTDNKIGRAHV